jgi:membrane protein DedA with SNARE-associated domain
MPLAAPQMNALFTVAPAIALLALAGLVVAEAVLLPGMVLPGGTGVALAGALAGSGRAPVVVVAAVMSVAVLAGDHAAYGAGGLLIRW